MSKVIAVLNEMPKSCMSCNLSSMCGSFCSIIGDTYAQIGDRSEECPLKPLPKQTICYPVNQEPYWDGWNDCIDEILGENNE